MALQGPSLTIHLMTGPIAPPSNQGFSIPMPVEILRQDVVGGDGQYRDGQCRDFDVPGAYLLKTDQQYFIMVTSTTRSSTFIDGRPVTQKGKWSAPAGWTIWPGRSAPPLRVYGTPTIAFTGS